MKQERPVKKTGRIRIKKGRDGQYYFTPIARNGQVVSNSEGYTTSSGARRGIKALRRVMQNPEIVEEWNSKGGVAS